MIPNIPKKIYHYVFEFLSYENLVKMKLTNKMCCSVANNLIRQTPIHKNRWAWANERLKLNKNAIISSSNISQYKIYYPLFLWRIGFKVKFNVENGSLILIIQSVYHTTFKMLIHQFNERDWWYENCRCAFIPARLTPNNKEMDVIVCNLNNDVGETVQIMVDLADPANINLITEKIEEEMSIPISEFYYILFNSISGLKKDGLRCDNTMWGYTLEHSDHTESQLTKWAMIRTFRNVYYHLYQFENNVQIRSQCIIDFENCHENVKSVGAGKYVIKLQRNGNLWVFVAEENVWMKLQYDKDLITITKIIESHYDGNNIIVLRDIENIVFVICTLSWKVTKLLFCEPHSRFHLYFDFRNKLLHWVDYDETPHSRQIN